MGSTPAAPAPPGAARAPHRPCSPHTPRPRAPARPRTPSPATAVTGSTDEVDTTRGSQICRFDHGIELAARRQKVASLHAPRKYQANKQMLRMACERHQPIQEKQRLPHAHTLGCCSTAFGGAVYRCRPGLPGTTARVTNSCGGFKHCRGGTRRHGQLQVYGAVARTSASAHGAVFKEWHNTTLACGTGPPSPASCTALHQPDEICSLHLQR